MAKHEIEYVLRMKFDVAEEESAEYGESTFTRVMADTLGDFCDDIDRRLRVYHNVSANVEARLKVDSSWLAARNAAGRKGPSYDELITAMREIANYRNNDAQLRALRIARDVLGRAG